jgi:hypothetical protein
VGVIEDLAGDWRRLDERIAGLSSEIEAIARRDGCERLMTVPGIEPIISSAMVAAIGDSDAFAEGRDFAAWIRIASSCEPRLRQGEGDGRHPNGAPTSPLWRLPTISYRNHRKIKHQPTPRSPLKTMPPRLVPALL